MEEGIISMLYESGMPPSFWGEALSSFIHIHNRVTTTALPGSTPHEALLGIKPDVSILRVWGCTAYVLIQKDKRPLGSLGSHMEKCVLIGYPQGYKAWKFYNPETKKVIVLSLFWSPPLLLCNFHISWMTLWTTLTAHSSLFMGEKSPCILNSLLFGLRRPHHPPSS